MATVSRKTRKITLAPKPKATKTVKVAKPSPGAKSTPRVQASRFVHSVESSYTGISPTLNSRKSRTPLRIEDFGTAPNLILSERDNSIVSPLRKAYGTKPFPRGNLDAGIANRCIRKGILNLVSGDPTHETATLAFVR